VVVVLIVSVAFFRPTFPTGVRLECDKTACPICREELNSVIARFRKTLQVFFNARFVEPR
jgi:hypothetical protein